MFEDVKLGLWNVVQTILSGSLFYKDSFPELLAGNMIFIPKEIVISQNSLHYWLL